MSKKQFPITQWIAKNVYSLFRWLDRNHIERYDYETAPYCGHHHNGHNGKYTESHYHEGDGSCYNKKLLWLVSVGNHTDEGWFIILFPPLHFAFKWITTLHKRITIKIVKRKWLCYSYRKMYKSKGPLVIIDLKTFKKQVI